MVWLFYILLIAVNSYITYSRTEDICFTLCVLVYSCIPIIDILAFIFIFIWITLD